MPTAGTWMTKLKALPSCSSNSESPTLSCESSSCCEPAGYTAPMLNTASVCCREAGCSQSSMLKPSMPAPPACTEFCTSCIEKSLTRRLSCPEPDIPSPDSNTSQKLASAPRVITPTWLQEKSRAVCAAASLSPSVNGSSSARCSPARWKNGRPQLAGSSV